MKRSHPYETVLHYKLTCLNHLTDVAACAPRRSDRLGPSHPHQRERQIGHVPRNGPENQRGVALHQVFSICLNRGSFFFGAVLA